MRVAAQRGMSAADGDAGHAAQVVRGQVGEEEDRTQGFEVGWHGEGIVGQGTQVGKPGWIRAIGRGEIVLRRPNSTG